MGFSSDGRTEISRGGFEEPQPNLDVRLLLLLLLVSAAARTSRDSSSGDVDAVDFFSVRAFFLLRKLVESNTRFFGDRNFFKTWLPQRPLGLFSPSHPVP